MLCPSLFEAVYGQSGAGKVRGGLVFSLLHLRVSFYTFLQLSLSRPLSDTVEHLKTYVVILLHRFSYDMEKCIVCNVRVLAKCHRHKSARYACMFVQKEKSSSKSIKKQLRRANLPPSCPAPSMMCETWQLGSSIGELTCEGIPSLDS